MQHEVSYDIAFLQMVNMKEPGLQPFCVSDRYVMEMPISRES